MAKQAEFVILHGHRFIRSFRAKGRLTIGSSAECQLCFEGTSVESSWGALFVQKDAFYAQNAGGAAHKIEKNDAFQVGPFVLVHAGKGAKIAALVEGKQPGDTLQWKRDPYNLVVLLGGGESRRISAKSGRFRRGSAPGPEVSRPAGLTRGLWGAAKGTSFRSSASAGAGGAATSRHDSAPVDSVSVERVSAGIIRNLERLSQEPGERERVGYEFLEDMRQLSFPEIVALLRRLAKGWHDNYLERFYVRILASSPMLSFRWAAVIAERYAADCRGAGKEVTLPRLKIGLADLISPTATESFRTARELGGKMISGGPW